jgi:uncharacterized protein YaiE (UPF0345 family)
LRYPPYIHRTNETLDAKTRLIVPQGTNLTFSFTTRDTEQMSVTRDSLTTDLKANDDVFAYQFVAAQNTKFEVQVQNAWNNSIEPLPFSVDVIPDAYPDIRVESFDEQLSSDVYFSGLVTDDYGFSKLTPLIESCPRYFEIEKRKAENSHVVHVFVRMRKGR